jgi:hypothetical protein
MRRSLLLDAADAAFGDTQPLFVCALALMSEFFAIALILSLPYLAVLVLIAVLAPSERWVVGFIAMSGSVVAGSWIWHWMIGQAVLGPGYFAGLAMGLVLTMAYAVAILAYVAFRILYGLNRP